jgi:voltage-gated potassium channel
MHGRWAGPSHADRLQGYLEAVSWLVWAVFVLDFAARLFLAEERGSYAASDWYDVALIVLPMLRPLRLLRVLAFARVLNRSASRSLIGRVTMYVGGTAVAALFLGALAVLDVEQGDPGANIRSFGDALWWASTTVTTVGYGDKFPVTTEGRFVAVALMLVGLAVVGVITASVPRGSSPESSKGTTIPRNARVSNRSRRPDGA